MSLRIELTDDNMETIRRYSSAAEIGGHSQVREADSRQRHLAEDQLIGMMGEAAFSLWLTGGLWLWAMTREAANRCPHTGDNGCDLIGIEKLDVKTSRMRYGADPSRYHLLVRPGERHPGTLYIAAFVERLEPTASVLLAGWITEDRLPAETAAQSLPWGGAYALPVSSLNPLPPVRWSNLGFRS